MDNDYINSVTDWLKESASHAKFMSEGFIGLIQVLNRLHYDKTLLGNILMMQMLDSGKYDMKFDSKDLQTVNDHSLHYEFDLDTGEVTLKIIFPNEE